MSWRFTAVSVGWAVLVSSIGLGAYVLYFDEYDTLFVCLLAVNIVACASWLRGAAKRNKVFMVPPLIFWGILLSIWIFYAMFAVGTSGIKGNHDTFIASLTLLAVLTIFYVACYIFAVIICLLMKSSNYRNTSYIPPSDETHIAIGERYTFKT